MIDELTPAIKKMLSGNFLHKSLGKLATRVSSQAKKNVMQKRQYSHLIQDRGDLAKSIKSMKVGQNHFKVVVNEPHGIFVHEGTRPHYPPFQPIREWVSRKLGVKENPAQYLISRAIVQKIGKKGTKGRPFLTDAIEAKANQKAFEETIKKEIEKEMSK